jgi:hypothetical protein
MRRILSRSTIPGPCEFCKQGSAQQHLSTCPSVSPFLGARLVSRLSPLRRGLLMSRLMQHYRNAGLRSVEHEERAAALIGRLAALTA